MTKHNKFFSIFSGKLALYIEIILTVGVLLAYVPITISSITNESARLSDEINGEYNMIIDGYITTFNMLTGQIKEKLKENPSFDEMQQWLQLKEDSFAEQIGSDIYDGIALTYKGGYAHSWHYGTYENYDASSRPWYQQAKKADGKVAVVAPYVTYLDPSYFEGDDYILMTIAQKYNNDIFFDYDIKLADVKKLLSYKTVHRNGNIILYDPNGYILSSSRPELYAHNISKTDSVITDSLKNGLQKSAENKEKITIMSVDGSQKIMYSRQDSNGNTICLSYSFKSVILMNFSVIFLIVCLLISFEIWMFRRNRRINDSLRRRDLRLGQIIDASYDEKVFVNMDKLTFYGNKRAEKTLGGNDYNKLYKRIRAMAEDNKTAMRLDGFISLDALRCESSKELYSSQKFNMIRVSDGKQERYVYEISRMLTQTDNKLTASIFVNDVTEDAEILRKALHNARQASVVKGEFLARMSHEIRTPMNAIIGETTLAQYNIQNTNMVKECLNKVMISSKHLLRLINDILDMSAIENSKIKIANAKFDINNVVSSVTTLYYSQCKSKGITFKTELKNIRAEILMGDELRLSQIILNILSNSVKFTDKGGEITFSLEQEGISRHRVMLHFTIKDTGCGMSEEYMKRIFKPFEQENELTAKEHGGSGLGLAITKNLTQLMGGKIDVKSKQGVGTEFNIDVPCDACENQENNDRSASGDMTGIIEDDCNSKAVFKASNDTLMPRCKGGLADNNNSQCKYNFSGKRVLVADDNETNREVARGFLDMVGFEIDMVNDGKQCVEIFEKSKPGTYQVILMDVQMPEMNGYDATRAIRSSNHPQATDIAIIAMTANAFTEDIADSLASGMNDHISKPIEQELMYQTINRYINN